MPFVSVIIGLLLILLGKSFYFGMGGMGEASFTALIPAFFGIPILICGLIAMKSSMRKHAMHVVMVFAALGTLMPLGMLPGRLLNSGFTPASVEMLFMMILSAVLLVFGIRSFINARRARKAAEQA